jgi:hypothetical protein
MEAGPRQGFIGAHRVARNTRKHKGICMTTASEVKTMINDIFLEKGLSAPFKETGITRSGPSYPIEIRESGGGGKRDYSDLDKQGKAIQRQILEHQFKLQEAAAADPSYQKEAKKQYKETMKALSCMFLGEGDEHKEARKAFREGRSAY